MSYSLGILAVAATFFGLGYIVSNHVKSYQSKRRIEEYNRGINSLFSEILNNLNRYMSSPRKTKFHSRVNNTVSITTDISIGIVTIMYLTDKKDIAIFKDDKCIYTSDCVTKEILDGIILGINTLYHKDINDVIDLMGTIYSKKYFENKFKVKVEDLKGLMGMKESAVYDVKENDEGFDMNDILDKINLVGIDKLSPDEKDFLANYKK